MSIEFETPSSTGVIPLHPIAIKLTKEQNFDGTNEIIGRYVGSVTQLKIDSAAKKNSFLLK